MIEHIQEFCGRIRREPDIFNADGDSIRCRNRQQNFKRINCAFVISVKINIRIRIVARMDGDDICDSTRFEKQVKFLDEHPEYAIVSSPMLYFDENGVFGKGTAREGEASKDVFNTGTPFCHAPCMVRKEAYDKVGGYTVDKKLLRVEDYELWVKMYAAGYKGYNLGEYLYSMRDDRNAVARRNWKNRKNEIYAHWLAYKRLNLSFVKLLVVQRLNF